MIRVSAADNEARERFRPRKADAFAGYEEGTTTTLAFWRDDVVLAMFMGTVQWRGVGNLCGMVSEDARGTRLRELCVAFEKMLQGWAEENSLWRVSAYVQADQEEYQRFARLFGFHEEARLCRASPTGGDIFIYTRVFPWIYSHAVGTMPRRRQSPLPRTTRACGGTILDG